MSHEEKIAAFRAQGWESGKAFVVPVELRLYNDGGETSSAPYVIVALPGGSMPDNLGPYRTTEAGCAKMQADMMAMGKEPVETSTEFQAHVADSLAKVDAIIADMIEKREQLLALAAEDAADAAAEADAA